MIKNRWKKEFCAELKKAEQKAKKNNEKFGMIYSATKAKPDLAASAYEKGRKDVFKELREAIEKTIEKEAKK